VTTSVTALEKHECPACGAQAEWDPSARKLRCPFCGTESPYQFDRAKGKLVELDLVQALREIPERERGWQIERRSVRCQSCRAVMVFDPARVGQNCQFCGSPALLDYQELRSPIRPQGVLPFRVDAGQVRDDIRQWWRSRWFAPGQLAFASLVDTIKSLYIPYWTFDAQVHCPWTAEAGYYYYVSVPGRDAKGRPVMRQERRVRWEPAAGVVDTAFDDEPVPGTKGLPLDLLKGVEPFPTVEAVPYDTAFLSGHVVEHYQVVLLDAAQQSLEQMRARLESMCASQVPGDTQRHLQIAPEYSARTFKHVLVPVWLLQYNYGTKSYQVIANGYTGTIAGRRPYSAWKIAFAILLAAIVALVLIWANAQ
jgi:hypothetical protein